MKIDIKIYPFKSWNKYQYTYTKGNAFFKEKLLKEIELAKFVDYHFNNKNYKIIEKLNGFFSIVYKNDKMLIVASDIVRSFPIFYFHNKHSIFISDDPHWLKKYIPDKKIDEDSKFEFLLTGYVTGKDTLYKNIKQLQAAEIIIIDIKRKNKFLNYRYYNFLQHKDFKINYNKLLHLHNQLINNAFERLIKYANNRKIVIPLSGGFDSRLVAIMLKKFNYKNILAFTFGAYNCNEYKVSKEVATNLKIDWEFIPYDNKKTKIWYNSREKMKFNKIGNNLSNILLDRQFPAVWQLSLKSLIPNYSIFVPGHTGDFISGGHIPFNIFDRPDKEDLINAIIDKNYVLWKLKNKNLKTKFKNKIEQNLDNQFRFIRLKADRIYENWEWQERQVKLIINSSTRLYEFWNQDWWFPLWDKDYIQFWNKVPLRFRINNKLYQENIIKLYSKMTGLSNKKAKKRDNNLNKKNNFKYNINKIIKIVPFGNKIKQFFKKLYYSLRKFRPNKWELYETDWSKSYGRMNIKLYKKLLPYITGRTSCVTLEALGIISFNDEEISKEAINILEKIQN
jgi:asparagine synthase (glutamine-hydrolysing)